MRESGDVLSESDANTFELIQSYLYWAINNSGQQGNIRVHAEFSKLQFKNGKDGILVPVRVVPTKEIETLGIL